ncbi:divergent polysaccharide deacetylase family protein [Mangrovimicrobium sediminis]|uniref:Divergent polysaccharide deacetylase family protein n=1 Tax=Mangrovimicrobium sediminis TaxID=2562682 RepID=A0A4Z0M006_9GAMM|nr:divergent polysaccharide deacetylase family protein [Haliea sp. SAOS-164]
MKNPRHPQRRRPRPSPRALRLVLAWLLGQAGLALAAPAPTCQETPPAGIAAAQPRATVVLVIDDLGNSVRDGMAMVQLPGKLNLAILPHTPHGAELAEAGHAAGKEIMLHAPMSNAGGMALGRGALTPALAREDFDRVLAADLDAVPHVRGINNHMGSELTTLPLQMGWVMQALVRRDLFFIDSRTSRETVAAHTASAYSVPNMSRSVFLDNDAEPAAIRRQLDKLVVQALRTRVAVGIGHPYPATAAVLREAMPRLACRGIELALASEALARWGSVAHNETPEKVSSDPTLEAHFDAAGGHEGLGLGDGVLGEVEDAGGEHRVGAALRDAVDQMLQVAYAP